MQLVRITPAKTYAAEASAIRAAEEKFGNSDLCYLVIKADEGQFSRPFIGVVVVKAGVHSDFCVAG